MLRSRCQWPFLLLRLGLWNLHVPCIPSFLHIPNPIRQRLISSLQSTAWDPTQLQTVTKENERKRVLVCGDGDLSYSAWLAPRLASQNISLTATVLEEQKVHEEVYSDSQQNSRRIASFDTHAVGFGIDATELTRYFSTPFDFIQFNFPHWRGKSNHKRNRELLFSFFASARQVLASQGQVCIALCEGQGGATALTEIEWRQSWMAAQQAAEHGLLLQRVEPYQPEYNLSSHRGVDRPFRVGFLPKLYTFAFPNKDKPIEKALQLCSRHELHVMIPTEDPSSSFTRKGILEGDEILEFGQTLVPEGIRVEIPTRQELSLEGESTSMIVFLIVYCGERRPLSRATADGYRAKLETELSKYLSLRENRKGRPVSRAFPYPLLHHFVEEEI